MTIPKDAVPPNRLNELLDWLRVEEIAQRSSLSEAEADELAEELKSKWWADNKHKFISAEEP